jgi:diguanylate cyclase (GGDEF)-like protein
MTTARSAVPSPPPDDPVAVERLHRRWERERTARLEAEEIAERATRDLYRSLQEVREATAVTELLGSIAVAANETDHIEQALAIALERVCEHMGWPVGHALLVAPDGASLSPGGVWHLAPGPAYEVFRDAVRDLRFQHGVGLPGRVLESGEPAAILDLGSDPNFPRADDAVAAGLRSGFAFPVLVRSDVHAVLEFFSAERQQVDGALLRVMGQIGAQLGRVSERHQAEGRLTHLALHDALTGLPNRALLTAQIAAALEGRTGLAAVSTMAVLFIDLDDFKTINDSLGHAVGDQVLAEVADRFATVGEDLVRRGEATRATPARFAGDEFAFVLEGCHDAAGPAAQIRQSLAMPIHTQADEVFVTVSIGGATARPSDDVATLLRAADLAMHEAKRGGKQRFVLFETHMQDDATRRHQLAAALRVAVNQDDFVVHYQPVIEVASGRITQVEALVRWQHPELGLVAPGAFIGVAEETGLIVDLGQWVLEESCRQMVAWSEQHAELAGIDLAVNVSGRQLRDPDFAALVARVLERTGLAPQRLCLEITETVIADQGAHVEMTLLELRQLGVQLAIDDFGTGYSSLATLQHLPVHTLKIDRSFVANVPEDGDAGSIVWTIASLGHRLGLRVVAEGIESAAQLTAIRGFGCDLAQGYYCYLPAPPDDLLPSLIAGTATGDLRFVRLP